jgi:dethiobiotin synthetase
MRPVIVTGTGTEIGKTIVTAAIATIAHADGQRVAVVKPAQTGVAGGEESDVDVVTRLTAVTEVRELARYPEPLAPATAARRAGMRALPVSSAVQAIGALADHDLVLVEGAGGVLVRLDNADGTVLDIAAGLDADVVVVTAAGLGALNAAALTCDAVRTFGLRCLGVVIGSWPIEPDIAAIANLGDFPSYAGAPLLGAVPEHAGRLSRDAFLDVARSSLAPALGGRWTGQPPSGGWSVSGA